MTGTEPSGEEGPPGLPAALTAAQREAVTAADPLLCVLAGAGAGKTRVLTLRVSRRIADGSASADHTLVCTFSRKAADELRDRLWSLGVAEGVHAGTIHRTALSLLRQHRADRGRPAPVILGDRRSLVAEVMADRADRSRSRAVSETANRVESEIGWAKARMLRPDGYEAAAQAQRRRTPAPPATVAAYFRRYEEARRRRGLLDLDDLLTVCADTLAEDVAFADAVRWRYRHLFVDEMQDVNPSQFRLLSALLGDEPDLFVVGDPNQSVYGWNGADPSLLDRLPSIFAGTRVLRLDENQRSSPQVVAVAAAALGVSGAAAPSSARPDGPVPRLTSHETDVDEATWVAREVWRAHRPGRAWSGMAVLARTNAQLTAVAEALTAERVPHRVAGGDLGPASDLSTSAPASASASASASAWASAPTRTSDRRTSADEREPDDEEQELEGEVGGQGPSDTKAELVDDFSDAVTPSTFHRAKGLQWRTVFVIGLSEGLVPLASARTAEALAEERRLLYVALTRAEEELSCSWARRRGNGSGHPRKPSRWLEGVGPTLERLDRASQPPDPAEVAGRLAALRAQLAARSRDPG